MTSNLGFDDGHPYIEEGVDEGRFIDGVRVAVSDMPVPDTVGVTLERSVDGESWETVIEFTDQTNYFDPESLSYGDTLYRATGFTAEGAAESTLFVVEARSLAVWLSTGDGFVFAVRLPFNPSVQLTAARQRALKQYAGRSLPVAYAGEAVERKVSVSGSTTDHVIDGHETANVERLTEIAQDTSTTFMFRDPDGRRIYGVIGDISMPRQGAFQSDGAQNAMWGYSFTLTETER